METPIEIKYLNLLCGEQRVNKATEPVQLDFHDEDGEPFYQLAGVKNDPEFIRIAREASPTCITHLLQLMRQKIANKTIVDGFTLTDDDLFLQQLCSPTMILSSSFSSQQVREFMIA